MSLSSCLPSCIERRENSRPKNSAIVVRVPFSDSNRSRSGVRAMIFRTAWNMLRWMNGKVLIRYTILGRHHVSRRSREEEFFPCCLWLQGSLPNTLPVFWPCFALQGDKNRRGKGETNRLRSQPDPVPARPIPVDPILSGYPGASRP